MYIEPDTIIKVLKDVPLDNTYNHTVYFSTATAQQSYFSGLSKYTFSDQSYQRVNRGVMRLQRKADDLYDCNYIMFQNSAFGSKWFYAFITSVEYVNNITSQITYEIDVMQTWMFDYTLERCFVEREHAASDAVGSNLVHENLEFGDYVSDDFSVPTNSTYPDGILSVQSIVMGTTFKWEFSPSPGEPADIVKTFGEYYGGLYSGLHFTAVQNTAGGTETIKALIESADEYTDGIVTLFIMPSAFVTQAGQEVKKVNFTKTKNTAAIGSYTPRNKKLLTYPYNFLYATDLQGNYAEYRYEYFSGTTCEFTLIGDMSPSPVVMLVPKNYKGITNNYDEKMILSGYPQLPYTTDTFKAWLAQNGNAMAINTMTSAITNTAGGFMSGGPVGGAIAGGLSLIGGIGNALAAVDQHSKIPNQNHAGSGNSMLCAADLLNFGFMKKHIREEFAQIIDDYFDMFGYATHRVKVPNRNVRPHWTFTKTQGCVVTGSVPADDMNKICRIYDNGITFWKNGSEVGNYSLNNQV